MGNSLRIDQRVVWFVCVAGKEVGRAGGGGGGGGEGDDT